MSWYHRFLDSCSSFLRSPIRRSEAQQKRADRLASHLTLYVSDTCPYCLKVKRHIKLLNISCTHKNLSRTHVYQKELICGGGRAQVPCLRIENNKQTRWLYESQDIIAYLDRKFVPKGQAETLERAH